MEIYKVTEKDLIGGIKDFPIEVVQKMVERQYEQYGECDIKVFQLNRRTDNGFTWLDTPEGYDFWDQVIGFRNFDLFFDKYPKEMKKYWIKDLTENQVIHAPTKKIAERLCKRFDMLGLEGISGRPSSGDLSWYEYRAETCYSPSDGRFYDIGYSTEHGYEILTIDELLDFQTNEYPKVMEVSDHGNIWHKRVVFMEKNGKFLVWGSAESIEESENKVSTCVWEFAREIQPVTLELTIDQIADKFGVSPEQIKIKI